MATKPRRSKSGSCGGVVRSNAGARRVHIGAASKRLTVHRLVVARLVGACLTLPAYSSLGSQRGVKSSVTAALSRNAKRNPNM